MQGGGFAGHSQVTWSHVPGCCLHFVHKLAMSMASGVVVRGLCFMMAKRVSLTGPAAKTVNARMFTCAALRARVVRCLLWVVL